MKRLLLPLAAAALGLVGVLAAGGSPPPALACSVVPRWDPIEDAENIVAGRFTGWELAGKTDPLSLFAPVRVHMRVERVFKGQAPPELDIVDSASLKVYDHEPRYVWAGYSGSCGTFDFDPTGLYGIISVSDADGDGTFGSWTFGWLYVGEEPEGERYDEPVSRLESELSARVGWAAIAFVAAAGGALGIGAGLSFIRFRRRA